MIPSITILKIHYINLSNFLPFFSSPGAADSDKSADQSTSASWWRSHVTPGDEIPAAHDSSNFFSATHGIVQTHPALSSGVKRPASSSRGAGASPSINVPTAVNPNPKSPFRHLDFATSATAELRRNPSLSAPDECARACREGEPPRICYYHFTLEYYTVLGA